MREDFVREIVLLLAGRRWNVAELTREKRLVEALRDISNALGSGECDTNSCDGCKYEMKYAATHALVALREYESDRQATSSASAGSGVTPLDSPARSEPFGWWDTFNECFYRDVKSAGLADRGGNTLIALYESQPAQVAGQNLDALVARLRIKILHYECDDTYYDCRSLYGQPCDCDADMLNEEREKAADMLERLVRERDECRKWHEGAREVAKMLTERAEAAELERDALKNTITNITMGRFAIKETVTGKELVAWDGDAAIDAAMPKPSGTKPDSA